MKTARAASAGETGLTLRSFSESDSLSTTHRPPQAAGYQYYAALRDYAALRGRGVLIHHALGEFRQRSVRLFFLFKALVENSLIVPQIKLAGQSRGSSIGGYFLVLDFLSVACVGDPTD
jgi:predicted TIM-barrel fold metal-dependent hydrolase